MSQLSANSHSFRPFTEEEFNFRYFDPDIAVNRLARSLEAGHDLDDTVLMDSGRELRVTLDSQDTWLRISDGPYEFEIWNDTDINIRTVRFAVDTFNRDRYGRRHPDLYAGRLLTRSLALIEEKLIGGQPFERLSATWLAGVPGGMLPGDNFIQFEKGLKAGFSQEEAVFATWTGRQALRHGFSEVSSITYDRRAWLVDFDRPAHTHP